MKALRRKSGPQIGFAGTVILALLGAALVPGCNRSAIEAQKTKNPAEHAARKETDHGGARHSHVAPHGGEVQAVGDHHFELVYEGDPGRFILYVLGSEETKAEPIPQDEIVLQVRDEASGQFHSLTLAADPQKGDPDGKSSRFSGTDAGLAGLTNLTAVARVRVAGEPHRASFQFVGGKPISATVGAAEGFACPMACEQGKVYAQPGKCPVCKMKLEESMAGMVAHADHSPKHGGIFFMAPDNWHHLEGTLPSEHELRIYLYDNFTRPLAADGFEGELRLQQVNDEDDEVSDPMTVPIKPGSGKAYLVAELPQDVEPPYQTEARLKFPRQQEKFLFNFDFKRVQHTE